MFRLGEVRFRFIPNVIKWLAGFNSDMFVFDLKFHLVSAFMKADIFSNIRYVNTSVVQTFLEAF